MDIVFRHLCFVFALCFAFVAPTTLYAQITPPQGLDQAAAAGLSTLLADIPKADLPAFGFPDGTAPGTTTLGTPQLLRTITPASLAAYQSGQSPQTLLSDTAMWFYPVQIDGTTVAYLVMDRVDGDYRAVSLGYARLAKAKRQALDGVSLQAGEIPQIVAVFQAQVFFLFLPQTAPDRLFSLTASPTGGAASLETRISPSDDSSAVANVVARLLPVVQENLRQGY
jgi:hypothetical protein